MILIPQRKEENLRKMHSVSIAMKQQNSVAPTIEEIANRLNIDISEIKNAQRMSYAIISMDSEFDNESGSTYGDVIEDMQYSPEKCFFDDVNTEQVHDLVSGLSEIEQTVISKRFNFQNDSKPQTLRQLGATLGVSAETIRQTEMRAIKKLQKQVANTDISLFA